MTGGFRALTRLFSDFAQGVHAAHGIRHGVPPRQEPEAGGVREAPDPLGPSLRLRSIGTGRWYAPGRPTGSVADGQDA
ncbi:hypothetical protein [Streptomyces sp. RFCAC02]|uniref:hypothetical protein n=1 Tax=Streptomyces sp. RFCAC02 TaxID=2499143 RepID=UPI0010218CA9|nr:hypothetical protein [Streptomyces sp. RFCAC02]